MRHDLGGPRCPQDASHGGLLLMASGLLYCPSSKHRGRALFGSDLTVSPSYPHDQSARVGGLTEASESRTPSASHIPSPAVVSPLRRRGPSSDVQVSGALGTRAPLSGPPDPILPTASGAHMPSAQRDTEPAAGVHEPLSLGL